MKTVFKSAELPHLWAHQIHPSGRCPGNEHFEGASYYSYSTEIARIIKHNGKTAYLLNDTSYSVTTSGHQSGIRQAIPQDAIKFTIGGCGRGDSLHDVTGAMLFDYAVNQSAECASKATRAKSNKDGLLSRQSAWLKEAREISSFFGLRRKVDEKTIERLQAASKRAHKLQLKANKERQAGIEKENAELVQSWLDGGSVRFHWNVQKVFLRAVYGKEFCPDGNGIMASSERLMETSRGVTVPLPDAEKAFRFAIARKVKGWHRNGEVFAVGSYQLDAVNEQGVVAGCHRIEWQEIERFAKQQGWI